MTRVSEKSMIAALKEQVVEANEKLALMTAYAKDMEARIEDLSHGINELQNEVEDLKEEIHVSIQNQP